MTDSIRNIHLNLFHHYYQNGTIPIENNISRGLAISFQESPMLLMMFINLLNSKISDPFDLLQPVQNRYYVDFQKTASDFSAFNTILGVSLTTSSMNPDENTAVSYQPNEPITDISLFYGDEIYQTAIVIEVKRNSVNCISQLDNQLNQIIRRTQPNDELSAIKRIPNISLSWSDIIELLARYLEISGENNDRIVSDYYEHLCYCFPDEIPTKKLNEIASSDSDSAIHAIEKRLSEIQNEYSHMAGDYPKYGRKYIPLNWSTTSECSLGITEGTAGNRISLLLWPCATQYQYNKLCEVSSLDFLQKLSKIQHVPGFPDIEIQVNVNSMLTFRHFMGKWVYSLPLKMEGEKISAIIEFGNKVKGRHQRSKWEAFKAYVLASGYVNDDKDFLLNFDRLFTNSGKTFFDSVLNYKIEVSFSYKDACDLERSNQMIPFLKNCLEIIHTGIEDIM